MEESECKGLTDEVVCRREGRLGRITLNRPRALNALNLRMIRAIDAALTAWQQDDHVEVVVLDGASDRAFCAGGDIAVVREAARGDPCAARTLWREEYRLDAKLASYPRPVVAVMDGITMGGGIGLSAHTGIRVVTERSVLAMPEVAIGLAPDVGGAFLLARAPGQLGTHIALTGARLTAPDAIGCGLADHLVSTEELPRLFHELRTGEPTEVVRGFAQHGPPSDLLRERWWIDYCYAGTSVEDIRRRLAAHPAPGAANALAALDSGAPTALKVTLRALHRAASMRRLEECLVQDYRLSCRFLHHSDLVEGIRAAIVDKDRVPRWQPARLADVADSEAEKFFGTLGSAELLLD